jgi:Co/Zn/Cd efflux system component
MLITVFLINFSFFLLELGFWFFSNSMWLVADSLDMLSDSSVYIISLFAIWWTIILKKKISKIAGILQIILAIIWMIEVIRRFLSPEESVNFIFMIWIATLAFIWNYYALYLFNRQNSCEPHMKASQICTSNDLIVNVLVILSWIFVYLLDSNIPDLLIWTIIFIVVLNSWYKILKISK